MNIHTKKIRRLLGLTLGVQGLGNWRAGTAIGAEKNKNFPIWSEDDQPQNKYEKAIPIEQVTLWSPQTYGVELWS